MVFTWKDGSRHSVSAQVAGEVCSALERQNQLTAKNLVEVSRPEDAPLHKEFCWDDEKAAEMYREQQARVLIRHVVTVSETEEKPIRAFINLEVEDAEYYRIDTVLSSEDKYEKMLTRALAELRMFEKKYADLASLKPVFQAIDAIGA